MCSFFKEISIEKRFIYPGVDIGVGMGGGGVIVIHHAMHSNTCEFDRLLKLVYIFNLNLILYSSSLIHTVRLYITKIYIEETWYGTAVTSLIKRKLLMFRYNFKHIFLWRWNVTLPWFDVQLIKINIKTKCIFTNSFFHKLFYLTVYRSELKSASQDIESEWGFLIVYL